MELKKIFRNIAALAEGENLSSRIVLWGEPIPDEKALDEIRRLNYLLPARIGKLNLQPCFISLYNDSVRIRAYENINVVYSYDRPILQCNEYTVKKAHCADKVLSLDITRDNAYIHGVTKSWPMTLSDVARYLKGRGRVPEVIDVILKAWGEESFAWKQIHEDLKKGSAYTSIPVKTILESKDKYDLMQRHYGQAEPEANEWSIGKSILVERCRNKVTDLEIIKKVNESSIKGRLGRNCVPGVLANIFMFCSSTVSESLARGEKIPVGLDWDGIQRWQKEQEVRNRSLARPKITIPKGSRFSRLKVPGWKKISTRKALADACIREGLSCLMFEDLLMRINKDKISVWTRDECMAVVKADSWLKVSSYYGDESFKAEIEGAVKNKKPYRNPKKRP